MNVTQDERERNVFTDQQIREKLPDGTLIAINRIGRELQAITVDGLDVTDMIRRWTRKRAADVNGGLVCRHTKSGGVQWRQVPQSEVDRGARAAAPVRSASVSQPMAALAVTPKVTSVWEPMTAEAIQDFVKSALKYKPENLVIPEVSWKYLVRSSLRGKNILMLGPSGCGKTLAAQSIQCMFKNRPSESFNMGASQDPRGMLIGNTHFNREHGTFFSESLFVRMIQTPGAIILLDEISRAHDDAANILMTVLDENQRYLRIDEKPDTPTIPVAPGVVFVATANVGNEYTGTRVMDRALLDRFIIIEMAPMSKDAEAQLLKTRFAHVDVKMLEAVAEIADHTRQQVKSEDPKVSTVVSTRMSVEIAGLLSDGFTLAEAAEVCIFPFYPSAGGVDSERTYMQQLVQKYLPTEFDKKDKPWEADDAENKVPWST